MTASPLDRMFSIAEYVIDELAARGWSTAFAAARAKGNLDLNTLWLDLLCVEAAWWKYDINLSIDEANRLGRIFGSNPQTWLRIHAKFMEEKAKLSQEEIDAVVAELMEG